MKSFYKEWLRKNNDENKQIIGRQTPVVSESESEISEEARTEPEPSTSQPGTSEQARAELQQSTEQSPTDIVFENKSLQLIVEKASFKRQKRFRFQDHLFHVKIKLKNNNEALPFLKDILDFLEISLLHLMQNVKKFYEAKDENICYLTLHQNPMVIGLNSGICLCSLL